MKRFLAFSGCDYHPRGGMEDFVGDFDALDAAVSFVRSFKAEGEVGEEFKWGNVFDCVEMKIVWDLDDSWISVVVSSSQ